MKTTGLVLGKFLPLHKGHQLLISFANHFADTLYVVVDNIPNAYIAGEIRCEWLKQEFPDIKVLYLPTPNPQDPNETPDFWSIWQSSLTALLPCKIDYVFASENYGFKLAEVLESTFIPFDISRKLVPISGELIRKNESAYKDYLSPTVQRGLDQARGLDFPKSDFSYIGRQIDKDLKKICIFGPESTGKTTLAQKLAAKFQTTWVPEYACNYIEAKTTINQIDLLYIARGQMALEAAISKDAVKLLFCDTDVLTTCLWSDWLFGNYTEDILNLALSQHYDLYLLLRPDIPWQADKHRFLPGKGNECFHDCLNILNKYNRKYVIVSGQDEERISEAMHALLETLNLKTSNDYSLNRV